MGRASLPASRGDDGDSIPRSSRGAISGGVAQDGSWRHTPNPLYSADRGTINRNRTCPVVDRSTTHVRGVRTGNYQSGRKIMCQEEKRRGSSGIATEGTDAADGGRRAGAGAGPAAAGRRAVGAGGCGPRGGPVGAADSARLAETTQRDRYRKRNLVARLRLLGNHLLKDGCQFFGHVGPDRADRWWFCLLMLEDLLHERRAGERRLAGQQVVERAAQAVDIGANIDEVRVACLLGGDVVGGADEHSLFAAGADHVGRLAGDLQPGQAPVEDLDDRVGRALPGDAGGGLVVARRRDQEQVGRFDIAVDQAHRVRVLEPRGDLANVVARLADRQRAGQLHHLAQVGALDKLHGEVVRVADAVGVEGADDVRVRQPRHRLELALELAHRIRLGTQVLTQHLERDRAISAGVPGLVDLADPSLAETVEDTIRTDDQVLRTVLEEVIDLVDGEPAVLHKGPGKRLGAVKIGQHFLCQLVELTLSEQALIAEGLDQGHDRVDAHDGVRLLPRAGPGAGTWTGPGREPSGRWKPGLGTGSRWPEGGWCANVPGVFGNAN